MNSSPIQLPPLCIRSLNDKVFEKKKAACRQIEIMTKEWNTLGCSDQIKELIAYFVQDFINNPQPNSKIGGLLALSSVAIALDKDSSLYIKDIIRPIFSCAYDCNRDVRYRALEALYNVVKCVRGRILIYLDEIFDTIIRMCEDSDLSIREASNLVDKLIKDIIIENSTFNVVTLVEIIRERIYALTPNTRKMILSWISFLDSVPDVDLLIFIQDILDGLLKISCDANLDIRRTAEAILREFFDKIKYEHEKVEFKPLIKILLIHVQTDNQLVQEISLQCDQDSNDKIDATLQKRNTEMAKNLNEDLMNLVTKFKYDTLMTQNGKPLESENFTFDNIHDKSITHNQEEQFKISRILIVLVNELELGPKSSNQTKVAILEWILQIYTNLEIDIDDQLQTRLFDVLLNTLPDSSENVVTMDLKVLGKVIFKNSNTEDNSRNCKKLIKPLVDLFYNNGNQIAKDRRAFIICQLCTIMDGQLVYISFSEILLNYDRKFVRSMVHTLNTILLTSKELNQLRIELKCIGRNRESIRLFTFLYKTWCHSAVSVVSLCLMTKCYRHASELIMHFGNLNITIDILMEIDQLIQLLESPIFTSLRLDLLDTDKQYYLRKSLQGLLMLLPQSETFRLLRKRLQCVPILEARSTKDDSSKTKDELSKQIDFKELFAYFVEAQKTQMG
ncbi:hypothetical protein RDWZM_007083 [Blomia tropicalis]|uniref:Protein VAC14 homolog n=1 Tax=Blomia tropicalis TaxID=40697 RepID=A0A9Q0RP09_BLOTA|nr:hypothetical protein RDWZM_007083 [Blomia tropicalis]